MRTKGKRNLLLGKKGSISLFAKIAFGLFFCLGTEAFAANDAGTLALNPEESLSPNQAGKEVTVTVTDSEGGVIGANVVVKGTTNGSISDINGNVSLRDVPPEATIVVSYIGYITQEVEVKNRSSITVYLIEDSKALEEVVVIGYGTMRKKDLSGSISAINGEELTARHTTQLSTSLQGALSGVTVTRDSGSTPGSSATIQIRGVTTMSTNDPLIIIDGIPGELDDVNPEDVESMSVLKDAASAAIYGSRAAAGVIVITTKRAKSSELSLSYNYEFGWEMPTALPSYVGAERFMEMTNETYYNDTPSSGLYQSYTEDHISNYASNHASDPYNYPDVNWKDLLLKSSATRQTHTLSLSGGSENIRTKASFRYDTTDGIYENLDYERFMIRVNNDFKINKYISATLDVNFSRAKSVSPHQNPFQVEGIDLPSIYTPKWETGLWADVKSGENMLAIITDGGTNTEWDTKIGGKIGIDITPIDGLTLSAIVAPNFATYKGKSFVKAVPYATSNTATSTSGYMTGFSSTSLTESRDDNHDITTQFLINYEKTFGHHDLSVMLGYEDYYASWEYLEASSDAYELSDYPYLDLGSDDYRDNSGSAEEYAYRSWFGRLSYSYLGRYLFQFNFRRDGSSRFASKYRWANFPSVSAGWVLSEEKFFKSWNLNWLSFLKLRGSWGRLGNERIGSYYPYQASISFSSTLFEDSSGNISSATTAQQKDYAVEDISWETTETWDIGLDANFFNNRLRFSADYYKKKTKDMLLELEIPSYTGYSNPEVNAGDMNTKGWDIELSWRDTKGDFTYSITANLSDYTSKMGDLQGTEFLGSQVKMEGSEYNEWYGYLSNGLFQSDDDVSNSAVYSSSTKAGDIKYVDVSGPDGVPDGSISAEYDRVLLGSSTPHFQFGLNFNAMYKGWDFGITLQGVGSQNSHITNTMVEGLVNAWCNFPTLLEGKYWSSLNTDAQNAAAKYPRLTISNKTSNLLMSDYWLYNSRYIRLKNISLGYTLPKAWTSKAFINSVRFYVSASDLLTISGAPDGWDPESVENGYPINTSVVLGVSVKF